MALDVVEVLMRLLLVGEVTKGGWGALFEVTVPPLVVDDAVEAAACNCCWCAYSKTEKRGYENESLICLIITEYHYLYGCRYLLLMTHKGR